MLIKRQYGGGAIESKTLTAIPHCDYNFGRVWMIVGDGGYQLAMFKEREDAYNFLDEAVYFVTEKGNESYVFLPDPADTTPPWISGDYRMGGIQNAKLLPNL